MKPRFIFHEPKSRFAYMFDQDTVHLRLMVAKGQTNEIKVLFGDPFHWGPDKYDDAKWVWQLEHQDANTMIKEYETEDYDHYFYAARPATKRMRYAFLVDDTYLFGSRETVNVIEHPESMSDHFNFFNFPFLNEEDMFQAPSWVSDQIWYSIFPERFANGDKSINPEGTLPWGSVESYSNHQRFGGDLAGIIEHLDYLKEVGFTGLYLTPIFPSDSSHKYDVNDYYDIDPAFGDKETFRTLVEEAHKRGLKVMLDAVYNHCGFRHPYFQDVVKHGTNSKYYDCFYIIDPNKPVTSFDVNPDGTINRESAKHIWKDKSKLNYHTFAFTPYMPKLRTMHPIMKEYLLGAARYWITEFDIDGWRLDVSDEVPHAFWREFRNTVKEAKQDAYIIGENWASSIPWLSGDQYDGVMNYELLFPLWDYFGLHKSRKRSTTTEFYYHVNHILTNYPKHVLSSLYNLVDSHDTTRILEVCNNDTTRVQLPYLFAFSFPGAPSIYYGGEIGLSGEHDPDNRRCMIWEEDKQDQSLLSFMKTLIGLRKQEPGFRSVDFKWIATSDEDNYIVYQKEDLVFALSRNEEPVTITLPKEVQGSYKNLFTGEDTMVETISLKALGYVVLKQQK